MESLKDVYIDQLQDLYSANLQAVKATKDLARRARSTKLQQALERGIDGIEEGARTLQSLVRGHDANPNGEHCKGMEGLVREARAHAVTETFGSDAVRDAVIITQYQRMAHYAIAGYGCAAAFARQLGLKHEAETLGTMLEAAYSGDRTMSDIAEASVNERATQD